MNKPILCRFALGVLLLVLFGGCAAQKAFEEGEDLLRQERYDEAVARYASATRKEPERHEFRMRYDYAKTLASWEHQYQGELLQRKGELLAAGAEFSQAYALDPTNEAARQQFEKIQELLRARELILEAEEFYRARKFSQARNTLSEVLRLDPTNEQAQVLSEKLRDSRTTVMDGFELALTSDKPITLKFKEADVRDAFNILSRLSGINFIFDEELKAQKITVFLEDASFAQALELMLKMNNLGKKVLNAKTIIIYPKTKDKEKQYEDQLIQTFYLSNIDAKKAVNLLRTMLQLRKIYVHEELNALVIRDTPQVVQLAQQIIEAADRADAEVVFALELVEVNHDDQLDVGNELSNYSVNYGFVPKGTTSIPDNVTLRSLNNLNFLYTLPTGTFNFRKNQQDSEILANPKIRVKNKEKAKVHVGSREPVITITTLGTGSDPTTQETVQYIDVGIKLDIEANIQLDDTVVTKVSVEVSSAGAKVEGTKSTVFPITTTTAQTTLTIKDGEQTILGGLIRDDYKTTKRSIPFVGDIPLLGDLLSFHSRQKTKKEILLSITPHIVKNLEMPRADVASIWSGAEEDLQVGPSFGSFAQTFEPASEMVPPALAPGLNRGAPGELPPPGFKEVLPEGEVKPPVPEEGPAVQPAPAVEDVPAVPQAPVEISPAVVSAVEGGPSEGASVPFQIEPVPGSLAAAEKQPSPMPEAAGAQEAVAQVVVPPLEIPGAGKGGTVFLSGPTLVDKGEEFPLDVRVNDVENLYSAPLFVRYDPEKLQFLRADEGPFLKQEGQTTIFTTSVDQRGGRIIVGYKQGTGGPGASGSGELFRLFFQALTPGNTMVELERINFRTPSGSRLEIVPSGIPLEVR